ncbi:tRNA pseudouridine(55) synthase TruB [Myxococcota bacterium]|nr:tRNA pseudouridine(55) synthase TruB [Myxococcota bacterium]
MDGLLLLDKPQGLTSMQALARIKKLLRAKKAGHTGTLDPLATGILPICLGQATRLAQFLLASDKRYEAEILLGIETDTLDSEGAITHQSPLPTDLSEEKIQHALQGFCGPQEQAPPAYSALKIQGQRAYDLARAGQDIELSPRPIEIFSIQLLSIDLPHVRFSCHVSKGTYIRSMARDIGQSLGCGAHLTALRRTQTGRFSVEQALTLPAIQQDPLAAIASILPIDAMLIELPALQLFDEEAKRLRQGLLTRAFQERVPPPSHNEPLPYRALDPQQHTLALLQPTPCGWTILRVLDPSSTTNTP